MIAKSPYHLATLIALLALTGVTAIIAGTSHGVATLLVLAMAKILLVTFRFMDLRHAHLAWKSLVILFSGGILAALGLLAAG
jgi:hypothetical protein